MSKQSKKQRKRRARQKKQRRRKLYTLFATLYPHAPDEVAEAIIALAMSSSQTFSAFSASSTVLLKELTLDYVRHTMTNYEQQVDSFIENVLESLEAGIAYDAQTPGSLEQEPNLQALEIIKTWQWPD